MSNIEFFNNFNLDSPQFFENQFSVYFLYFLSTIAINLAAYLFVVVRFYKVLWLFVAQKSVFHWFYNPFGQKGRNGYICMNFLGFWPADDFFIIF